MVDVIILCLVQGVLIMCTYTMGVKVGMKVKNNEPIENPVIHTIDEVKTSIETNRIQKEEEIERKKLETMLENIDNYDGTGLGQKDL